MDDEEEAGPSSKLPKPLLGIHGAQANKLQCSICQETCDKKHQKRKKILEIKSTPLNRTLFYGRNMTTHIPMYAVMFTGILKKLFMVAKAVKLCFQMKICVRSSKKRRTIPLITMKAFRTMC